MVSIISTCIVMCMSDIWYPVGRHLVMYDILYIRTIKVDTSFTYVIHDVRTLNH